MTEPRPWVCPRCGRRFAATNQAHSCAKVPVRSHLEGKPAAVGRLYRDFARMVRATGAVRTHSVKSRIAFISTTTFAAAFPKRDRLDVHLVAEERLTSPRFRMVERFGPRTYVHHLSLRSPGDLDAELERWIRAAARWGRGGRARDASAAGAAGDRARAAARRRHRPARR